MISELVKVIKKVLIVLVLFILLDILFGISYKSFFMNQGPSRFNKMIYGNSGGQKEVIIIMGDSRAEHHYNSELIAKHTDKATYNYGSDGQSVFFNYAILRKLLDNYKPEKVIYEISLSEFKNMSDTYDRLLYFLPMHNDYAEEILKTHLGGFNLFTSKLFNAYKYNSSAFIVLKSYLSPKEYSAGYQPLYNQADEAFYQEYRTTTFDYTDNYSVDNMKVAYFEEILQLSKDFNFKIDFFISPTLFDTKDDKLFSIIKSSLSKYNYTIHNFLNDSAYQVSSFADPIHLNSEGADDYTREIISIIK